MGFIPVGAWKVKVGVDCSRRSGGCDSRIFGGGLEWKWD